MTDRPILEADTSDSSLPVEGKTLPPGLWTFSAVEDRLVEAMLTLWRLDDRERGFLRVRASDGPWHLIIPDAADYDGGRGAAEQRADAAIKPASLTRAEHGEMEEALGWVDRWAARDAKLIGLAVAKLAGGRREVPWSELVRRMGQKHGTDGLRMRYSRAITAICHGLNGGNPRATAVNPEKSQG